MRPEGCARALAGAVLATAALSGCGGPTGGDDRTPVVTNTGNIAPNQAIANQAEASGNDQPARTAAPANGSGAR